MATFARPAFAATALLLTIACAPSEQSPPADGATVVTEIRALAATIERDLGEQGPQAWLLHFEDDPDFFMASDGGVAFHDFAAAREFLDDFAPAIASIELRWSNLRVAPLGPDQATMAASYTELLRDTEGIDTTFRGYFTATVVRTAAGWKLRNAHWSSPMSAAAVE